MKTPFLLYGMTNGAELMKAVQADAELGRMGPPQPLATIDQSRALLVKRFSVVQGAKIRPIDDGTACGINSITSLSQKMYHHTVDDLHAAAALFVASTNRVPGFYKIDIDSAFRRVPVLPEHRAFAYATFRMGGKVICAPHFALPFGFSASVDGWDRTGGMLRSILAHVLWIGILRYVDDYFGADDKSSVEHAAQSAARLVRLLFGPSAVADRKIDHGESLVVLGLRLRTDAEGLTATPAPEKAAKWLHEINAALVAGKLSPGAAAKMAGRLSWAGTAMFNRLGRAILRRETGSASPVSSRGVRAQAIIRAVPQADLHHRPILATRFTMVAGRAT
jgi:hypothetical protein